MRSALFAFALLASLSPRAMAQQRASGGPQLEAEVGVADFNRQLSTQLRPGPCWGVRAHIPLQPELSLTIAYEGAATRVDVLGTEGSPMVTSNGGFAAIRLGLPAENPLRPYAFVGLGLMRNTVPDAASEVLRSDTAGIVPTGFGLEGDLVAGFSLGGRLSYNLVFDNDLLIAAGSLAADLWSATLTAAYRF